MGIVYYEWVIAAYPPASKEGKRILELASMGVGYHLLNKNRLKTDNLLFGFKFVANKPLPDYLTFASPEQSKKLEALDQRRRHKDN